MLPYFADTWFLLAVLDRRDAHHARARRLRVTLGEATIITHDFVLSEVLAHFADDGAFSRARTVDAVRRALHTWHVIPADRPLFLAALDRYASRPDKEYSLVDCMSMIVMEERGIRHVLTNDHHFSQAGFLLVNE
ncbi:MAG TPA: PIN domain-containing protein [Thermoanaerobaculia bacterium]|nr:PIN domain-containing protein [Thermoanaerobaculia bacterium]